MPATPPHPQRVFLQQRPEEISRKARQSSITTAPLVADSCAASTAPIASSGVITVGRVPSRLQRAK